MTQGELPIIQKAYDLIRWYVPILNRLPRDHKFNLGDRIIANLYDILELLVMARFNEEKLHILKQVNSKLEVLRHQTRLLYDFTLIDVRRYEYASSLIGAIGQELGGWIKYQKQPQNSHETSSQSLSSSH